MAGEPDLQRLRAKKGAIAMHSPTWSLRRPSRTARLAGLTALLAAAVPLAASPAAASPAAASPLPAKVTVFATGLNNPRGLAFGPGGDLYVAEGGLGGSLMTTPADCARCPMWARTVAALRPASRRSTRRVCARRSPMACRRVRPLQRPVRWSAALLTSRSPAAGCTRSKRSRLLARSAGHRQHDPARQS